jgi:predicted dehydrogenase
MAHRPTEEAVRERTGVGVVGAGHISSTYLAALLGPCAHLAKLAAIADINHPRAVAAAFACETDACPDHSSLLRRSDVHLVIVLTPPGSHYEIAMAALLAGKHVCVVKPLTIELAEADRLIAAAARSGLKLFAGHPYRYDEGMLAMRTALDDGRLGSPVRVFARSFLDRTSLESRNGWYFDIHQSGGLAIENLVHALDLMAWFLGPVSRVHAEGGCFHTADGNGTVPDDQIAATYRFVSGAIGVLDGAVARSSTGNGILFEVVGTKATVWRDPRRPTRVHLSHVDLHKPDEILLAEANTRGEPSMLRHFLECVHSDTSPPISGIDGRYAIELAWATRLSHVMNAPVSLPLVTASYPTLKNLRAFNPHDRRQSE